MFGGGTRRYLDRDQDSALRMQAAPAQSFPQRGLEAHTIRLKRAIDK